MDRHRPNTYLFHHRSSRSLAIWIDETQQKVRETGKVEEWNDGWICKLLTGGPWRYRRQCDDDAVCHNCRG